ncbi:threonine ammonia-lyase IlvA [Corynebacterium amycolatum]|uniref:L-threonine dehydratase n=1 Tax=Corynebacterium amycolatum TaxID=43765 RepID=A0AB37GA85_CORAY|nr:threonine ammonia-lyase IlvA [Corynebacterium amycolatum]MCQ9125056.1 threonine ammonia-lyase IlvA [Corynebacterium amycolatum]MCQ9127767.1 threonine ammonia-lyase IlvA [Corynebacterium amycolatum]MCQ9141041.1 threonine ammonia-lyase IlvA [Corynebacterium amycolatum]MCQ9168836.1 threonine ammonia-lyase IlvA [Corynebacterium amycolatum]MCQ9177019.1 threonine ammonia-lyase IlvA [Corynebacterium amycolatum]
MSENSVPASQPERRLVHAADIQIAQARISSVIAATPLQFSPRLSEITGAKVFLKREDLQDVRSYKIRGAYNAMVQLTDEERAAGVVAASAGNHAQGVAYACRQLGIKGRIYVPNATPKQKRDRIAYHGRDAVEIVVVGDSFDEAAAAARADAQRTGATMVEPFDSFNTIVGQGTVAAEIIAQLSGQGLTLDTICVPVGGGGLLSGVTSYLSDMSPNTQVMGVEPAGAACMRAALENNGPITLGHTDPFVDGAAVARFGDLPWHILEANRNRVHPMIAPEGAVCEAQLDLYQNEGIIAEPAGALSVAALEQMQFEPDEVVVCIISGGNNDVLRYAEIMERSLVYRGLKHYFLVNFPQKPGQLRMFLSEVLGPDDDISQFEYLKRNNRETGAALVGIELRHASDLEELLARMDASPLKCRRLVPGTPEYDFLT